MPLVPDDDLYARLEVSVDASPEAIELAWRALLKRHHPDVAGDDRAALDRAKRINVAHDWLSDPTLRRRYDRERLGIAAPPATLRGRYGVRFGRHPRAPRSWPAGPRAARRPSARPDLVRGEPAERLARFRERVARLTTDELDRLEAAEPPPIAFVATIRRFLSPDARADFAATEASIAALVPPGRWASAGLREALLGVAAELALSAFLDDNLAEPFRGRARERLLRAWEASVDRPRYGPNGAEVVAMQERVTVLTGPELAVFLRASMGIAGDERPWPAALDRDEDEALRISAELAARDVAGALPDGRFPPAAAQRARRLLARLGHVTALRHAFPARAYASLTAPWRDAIREASADAGTAPGVRRAR